MSDEQVQHEHPAEAPKGPCDECLTELEVELVDGIPGLVRGIGAQPHESHGYAAFVVIVSLREGEPISGQQVMLHDLACGSVEVRLPRSEPSGALLSHLQRVAGQHLIDSADQRSPRETS